MLDMVRWNERSKLQNRSQPRGSKIHQSLVNSRFSVHIADQQLQHFVPTASQTLQSLHLTPKPRNLGMGRTSGHAPGVEIAYIACSVGVHSPAENAQVWVVASVEMGLCMPAHGLGMTVYVAAAVVDRVQERMKNVGSPGENLGLAVGLGYMQDE